MLKDAHGRSIQPGMTVKLLRVPDSLLADLPRADQNAIKAAARESLVAGEPDGHGNVELEFRDRHGQTHWIWVDPKIVEVATA